MHLDDAYATGSSMLPQKKNADIAELARGKAGRLIGHLTGFLTTLKGLPLAYDRDLQEDKEPLFRRRRPGGASSRCHGRATGYGRLRHQAMARAADSPVLAATDLAEWLVQKGMPSATPMSWLARSCAIRSSAESRSPNWWRPTQPSVPTAVALLEPGVAVTRRTTPGGAGPGPVMAQLDRFASVLRTDSVRFGLDEGQPPPSHLRAGATGGRPARPRPPRRPPSPAPPSPAPPSPAP